MSDSRAAASHGELKRRIAARLGTDPERYGTGIGTERHKRLTAAEIDALCEALGLGFLDGPKQERMNTVMLKLGRDHRTGAAVWDSADLRAVLDALDEAGVDDGK